MSELRKIVTKPHIVTLPLFERALVVAAIAHTGWKRAFDAAPYITHPFHVSELLREAGAEEDEIISGVLHDTVEDTDITLSDLILLFGEKIADLVDELTKPFDLEKADRLEYFMGMMVKYSRSALRIKLADKLHNISTRKVTDPLEPWDRWMDEANQMTNMVSSDMLKDKVVESLTQQIKKTITYYHIDGRHMHLVHQKGEAK